ncbi:MAG: hypothetical protein E7311_05825 [Clostridiales bacterium]|nr:hypothetical protein [Clostridiales bacterium]
MNIKNILKYFLRINLIIIFIFSFSYTITISLEGDISNLKTEINNRKTVIETKPKYEEICISERYTTFNGNQINRTTNIKLATDFINGTILQPGEEFSYNTVVGKRTSSRGFKAADGFVKDLENGGYKTQKMIGGGICQVSSTLHMSVKSAKLKVTERKVHGMPVSYCSRADEATVSWGTIDFKFVNNTENKIRIEAYIENNTKNVPYKVVCKIWKTVEVK